MVPRRILILFVLVLITASAAYFWFSRNKAEKPSIDRAYTNEKVTESATGILVTGFPDIPVYEGFELDKSYLREQGGKKDYSAFWYYDQPEEKVSEIYKWYIEELKKKSWDVKGPFIDESEREMSIVAENSDYLLRIYNSERDEGDAGGKPGNIFSVSLFEK